ncbi:MAG TPA: 1,4-alpha-glucan branching protein GlgB [Kofleriaceae bacterium]|nr:1,4-alpha-glucan branching protein GlgB [Kofleriaceae bacterium]
MPRLTDDDREQLRAGTFARLHERLGAHPIAGGGVEFGTWAPNARKVEAVGDWDRWADGTELSLDARSGTWHGVEPRARPGHRYKYRITGVHDEPVYKADPLAFAAELAPATASVVWAGEHAWHDALWMKQRADRARRDRPWSIYEVHLGSWQRAGRDHGAPLGYRELGPRLADHAVRLGFTHVELLPVMEHPFYGSWGYQVTGYFAATSRYGQPEDLMELVDTLHRAGVGVSLDWVPAHFPTDAHGLGRYDGTALYEHDDPRRGFHPDWHSYIFDYGRAEVRSFLLSSALWWLERFHADGLRVDGVASMLYRDYSRRPGEWIPDWDGSNHDRDAISFLQQLNRTVHARLPDAVTLAEESTAWGGVTHPPEQGGLGFDYKWDLGWMHDTLDYLRLDPIHRRWHHHHLTFRSVYADSEQFVLPLSHDEVVHSKRSLYGKLPGDDWQQRASLRLLYGYQWALPGKKLLFMGGELAAPREWDHDGVLDWSREGEPGPAGVAAWLADLNRVYREQPALHRRDGVPGGMEWLIAEDRDHSLIVFLRHGELGDPTVMVACNFTPVPRHHYRVPLPRPGRWRELLNSDAELYGGSGQGNFGEIVADPEPWHGRPASAELVVPPLGCIYLIWAPIEEDPALVARAA